MSERSYSLKELIACVGREVGLRRNVYPKWIASKRMSQAGADAEIAKMQAVYDLLKSLGPAFDQPPKIMPEALGLKRD